jgi:dolichol-phosphate mannosyltransferase
VKKINIILPVYNEAEVIEDFNSELFNTLGKLKNKYKFEVIYIVDKCQDKSFEILKSICNKYSGVKAIKLSRRFGHQLSLVAGMDKCDGDAVIMMDSDLEHPPCIIESLLEKFEEGFDIVQTKRIYNKKISPIKKMTSKIFYKSRRDEHWHSDCHVIILVGDRGC